MYLLFGLLFEIETKLTAQLPLSWYMMIYDELSDTISTDLKATGLPVFQLFQLSSAV